MALLSTTIYLIRIQNLQYFIPTITVRRYETFHMSHSGPEIAKCRFIGLKFLDSSHVVYTLASRLNAVERHDYSITLPISDATVLRM